MVDLEKLATLSEKATQSEGMHGHSKDRKAFRDALLDFWRSGGAELARDGLRFRTYLRVYRIADADILRHSLDKDAARQVGGEER